MAKRTMLRRGNAFFQTKQKADEAAERLTGRSGQKHVVISRYGVFWIVREPKRD